MSTIRIEDLKINLVIEEGKEWDTIKLIDRLIYKLRREADLLLLDIIDAECRKQDFIYYCFNGHFPGGD